MPLTLNDKKFIADLFSESYYIFGHPRSYAIKTVLLAASSLLWNQKNPVIRLEIAKYFAQHICAFHKSADGSGLEEFFIRSILSSKVDDKLFQDIIIKTQYRKNVVVKTIEDLKIGLNKKLETIFKNRVNDYQISSSMLAENSKRLQKWANNYPYEFFNSERQNYLLAHKKLSQKVSLMIFVFLYYLFSALEEQDSYAFGKAALIAIIIYSQWVPIVCVCTGPSSISVVNNNVHFDLEELQKETLPEPNPATVKRRAMPDFPPLAPLSQPIMSIVVGNQQPSVWENAEEEEIKESIVKPSKKRSLNALSITNIAPPDGIEKAKKPVTPDFFGKQFAGLSPQFMVEIDNSKNRKNSYFAIWDKPSICCGIRTGDWDTYDELFKVFTEGNITSGEGESGIKILKGIGFFQIKKAATKARVVGEEVITKDGYKTIVFREFNRQGYH